MSKINLSVVAMSLLKERLEKIETNECERLVNELNVLNSLLSYDLLKRHGNGSGLMNVIRGLEKQNCRLSSVANALAITADEVQRVLDSSVKAADEIDYIGKRSMCGKIFAQMNDGMSRFRSSLVLDSKLEAIRNQLSERVESLFSNSSLTNHATACSSLGVATLCVQEDYKNQRKAQLEATLSQIASRDNVVEKYITDPIVKKVDSVLEESFGFTTKDLTNATKGYFSNLGKNYSEDFETYISDPTVEAIDSVMEDKLGFTTGDLTKATSEYFANFGKKYAFYYNKYSSEPMEYWSESVIDLVTIIGHLKSPKDWYSLLTQDIPNFAEDYSAIWISYAGNVTGNDELNTYAEKVAGYDGGGNLILNLDMQDGELGALGTLGLFLTGSNEFLDLIEIGEGLKDGYDLFTNPDKVDKLKMLTGLSSEGGSGIGNLSRIAKFGHSTSKAYGEFYESYKTDEDYQKLVVDIGTGYFKGTKLGAPFFKIKDQIEDPLGMISSSNTIQQYDTEMAEKITIGDRWVDAHLDEFDKWYGKRVDDTVAFGEWYEKYDKNYWKTVKFIGGNSQILSK